ncbi:MAG: Sua5/YciO/YrdC/YwlC family protein, partial [Luteimonas sp.]|nr:Sua5/YciO/YrdC/YwlC family protein [Luteimonas sp.]
PVVVALCEAFGGALVSTSANRTAEPAPRTRADLDAAIIAGADAIVAGETTGLDRPTAIRDARDGRELR